MDKSPPYTHKKYNKNFQRPEVEELTEKTKQREILLIFTSFADFRRLFGYLHGPFGIGICVFLWIYVTKKAAECKTMYFNTFRLIESEIISFQPALKQPISFPPGFLFLMRIASILVTISQTLSSCSTFFSREITFFEKGTPFSRNFVPHGNFSLEALQVLSNI